MAYSPDHTTFRTKGALKFLQKYPLTSIGVDPSFAATYKGTITKVIDVAADGNDPTKGVVKRTIRMQRLRKRRASSRRIIGSPTAKRRSIRVRSLPRAMRTRTAAGNR